MPIILLPTKHFFAFALLGLLPVFQGHAQTTAPLTVTGAVAHPLSWSAADLTGQPHVTVKAKDKQGKLHAYTGVPLSTILTAAGAVADGKLHGKEFMKALKIKAADD